MEKRDNFHWFAWFLHFLHEQYEFLTRKVRIDHLQILMKDLEFFMDRFSFDKFWRSEPHLPFLP